MKEGKKLKIKKNWKKPELLFLNIKKSKGGLDPYTVEDEFNTGGVS